MNRWTTAGRPIVYLDTETTGLHPGRLPWEIAMIRSDDHGRTEVHLFVDQPLTHAEAKALEIGGYWDRHPHAIDSRQRVHTPAEAAVLVETVTRDAIIVGSKVQWDCEHLETMMRTVGLCPSWHHHPIDIQSVLLGWLLATQSDAPNLPLSTSALSRAAGIEVPVDRHTAMADARWVEAMWIGVGL